MVLPYIDMNPPRVYTSSQSWILLPPPTPYHLSGSSPCTSPKHPVSCIEHRLALCFLHDSIHVSMPFSQIIPPSSSPTESKSPFYTSVSLLLSHIQGHHYHLSKFRIYVSVYYIGVFLSPLILMLWSWAHVKCTLEWMKPSSAGIKRCALWVLCHVSSSSLHKTFLLSLESALRWLGLDTDADPASSQWEVSPSYFQASSLLLSTSSAQQTSHVPWLCPCSLESCQQLNGSCYKNKQQLPSFCLTPLSQSFSLLVPSAS